MGEQRRQLFSSPFDDGHRSCNCYPDLKNILKQQAAVDGALGSSGRVSFPAGTAAHYRRSFPGQR